MALATAGCSDPSYMTADAATSEDDERPDASALTIDAGQPSSDPRGRYALLERFYGEDAIGVGGWFSEDHLSLAEIGGEPGNLELTYKPCRARVDAFAPLRVSGELLVPEQAPSRTLALESADGVQFRSQGAPSLLGYEPVSNCPAGTRVPKPDRSWLRAGTCVCPSGDDSPPTNIEDCRVIDSDGDTHPGATVRYSSGNDSYMAIRDRSQLLSGTFDARGRHRATLQRLADVSTMQCTAGPCSPVASVPCASQFNPVHFEPLPATAPDGRPWTCSALVSYVASHPFELDDPTKPDC